MGLLTRLSLAASIVALSACPGPGASPDAGAPAIDAGIDAGESIADGGHSATGLVALPERVAFGNVGMIAGAQLSVTRKLSLFYAGAGQDLVIEGWEVSGEEVGVTGPELPVRLEPRAGANVVELEVTLTPASLGAKSFELKIRTDDPDRPEHTVEISAQVVPTPDCTFSPEQFNFNFGLVSPPDYRDITLQISNDGTLAIERCRFTGIQLTPESDAGLSLIGGPIAERVIEPGEVLKLVLRVPTSPATGALEFDVNSSRTPHVRIPITIAKPAAADCITIAPGDLDFGELMAGCSSQTRTFSVYNTCASEVRIQSFQMTSVAGQHAGGPNCPSTAACPEFHLVQSPPIPTNGLALLATAPPVTFQVKYRPIDAGPDVGAFELSWSVDGELRAELVSFSGRGVAQQQVTETHVQTAPPRLDVLFVLDDSPSMANEQASVAANLNAYLQYLKGTYLDFHLGVVSADPAAGSTLRTGSSHPDAVLGRSSTNLDAQFAAKIDVGTSGAGSPRCLEQSVAALTNAANAGFLRANAQLKVVCVTDSTDHSPLPVSDYVTSLEALKQTASMVDFDAAAGFTPSCPGDLGRLADAITQTSGAQADLCSTTWWHALQYLTFPTFPPAGYPGFYLSSVPDLAAGPLVVKVDGQVIADTDASGATVWFYDPMNNSVFFTEGHKPQVGQVVEITYFTQCYP